MRLLTSEGKRRCSYNLLISFDISQSEKAANLEDDDVDRILHAVFLDDTRGDADSVRRLHPCRLLEEEFESIPLE